MAIIGILHNGSQAACQGDITSIRGGLIAQCTSQPDIRLFPWQDNLDQRAQSLIQQNVQVLIAAGGSRSAIAAINARGQAQTPIIVFTSVAPYVLNGLNLNITTGVCAHTSDHDGVRLGLLAGTLSNGRRVGVLRSSNRGDQQNQISQIQQAARQNNCTVVPRDINSGLTIPQVFTSFHGNIDALLVAADPFFYHDISEVVQAANQAGYPSIYQWREFVDAGGMMSYGLNRAACYNRATTMAANIANRTLNPPYTVWQPNDPGDFELVANSTTAQKVGLRALPDSIAKHPKLELLR